MVGVGVDVVGKELGRDTYIVLFKQLTGIGSPGL